MAPISKKRRTSFVPTSHIAVVVPARSSIASFGRVSKAIPVSRAEKDEKLCVKDENILRELGNGTAKSNGSPKKTLKRKPESDLRTPAKSIIGQIKKENVVPAVHELRNATPEPSSSSIPDTPTKGTRTKLEAFTLTTSSSSHQPTPTFSRLFPTSSSPAIPTPCPPKSRKRRHEEDLPTPVQDLIDLHTSFLSVLSLHYAHNGTATPVDLRTLLPGIGKSFSRRAPRTEDIRRILAIQERGLAQPGIEDAPLLNVWDHGMGRICIEYNEPAGGQKVWGKTKQPLETQNLTRTFSALLRELYENWQRAIGYSVEPEEFVAALPLSRLHKRAKSKVDANKEAIFGKGQTRLSELKASALAAQKRNAVGLKTESEKLEAAALAAKSSAAHLKPSQRSDSLLSRIRAKESLLASAPAGPTQAQLERRAALQRLPEVINIISQLANNSVSHAPASSPGMLSPSPVTDTRGSPMSISGTPARAPRASSDDALAAMLGMASPSAPSPNQHRGVAAMFAVPAPTRNVSMSLQQVVARVRESMRTPMAADEVERVVRLLAGEVCPEWVVLREIGSVKGVTIRGGNPSQGWQERVGVMMESS